MSRLTGKEVYSLMEAYQQVYAPKELTEEQVWEEVEYWVNSLLEEGYDLSDYTWEEMYEAYDVEAQKLAIQRRNDALGFVGNQARRLANATVDSFKTDKNPTKGKDTFTASPKISAERPKSKFAGARDAAIEKAKQIKGSPVVGEKPRPTTPSPSSGTPTPRPAAASPAANRPTATSSGPKTTPTAPTTPVKPAMGTTAGGTKFERRTPTSAELGAAQASRAAGGSEENAIKAGVGASKPTTPAPNPVKANVPGLALGGKDPRASTPTPAPTPAASPSSSSGSSSPSGETDRLKKALDIKKSDVTSSFDMFDVVKGYLIGEGYADTEEAALAIMANMSEDWKYSIMEQQISSVSANAPSGVKKPSVNASISAGGKTPPGQKMLDKAGQMLSGKGPSNNFGRGF